MIKQILKNRLNEQYRKNKLGSPTVYLGGKYVTRMVFAIPLQ
ncbi:hypothetical protein ACIQD3_08245 [Peribacillus loiseleuriae]